MVFIRYKIKEFLLGFSILLIGVAGLKEIELKLSNETLNNVVYADTVTTEDIYAEVALGNFVQEVDTAETVAVEAVQKVHEEARLQELERIETEKQEREMEAELEARKYSQLSFNPFVKSKLTVMQYNNILKGTGLAGAGQSFYNMEQTYNINGLFAIGVALHESGLGFKLANTNNFFGMRGKEGWKSFNSVDDNIQYFGQLMSKRSYYGKSILEIGKVYCPGTYESWAARVQSMMVQRYAMR